MTKPKIGFIGVGLMGHGAAKNILEKGYGLTVLGNRNRQPVDDLVKRGAKEGTSPAALARDSDVLFTCVPSSVEVEALVFGAGGILEGAHPGLIVVDSTTADPNSTRKIGAALKEKGARMADAPLGRSPKEAEAGTLSTYVGGDPDVVAAIRPVQQCFADTIVEVGALGAGHTLKLINNFMSIGNCAIIAEAATTAAKMGVDMRKFHAVISAGGANSKMFQMVAPWLLEGDDSHLKGPLRIAGKDLRFYNKLAEQAQVASFIGQAVNQWLQLCNARGH
ncbi:MAG: NAD(P)-dependent oxidoreductase, partial [Alphaproteobacteria bacterium]|nr:NAD(P)-dependent oxidoreductase [Alphaproteobacteria bacterium]